MSHGRLTHHQIAAGGSLGQAPLGELGAELLARLTADVGHGSRQAFEKHLQLLTLLHDATGARMETPENRLSVAHMRGQFRFVAECWRRHGLPIDGAVHVDIGCGSVNPFARLFAHAMLGLRKGIGVDLDVQRPDADSVRCLARLASAGVLDPASLFGDYPARGADVLARLAGFDLPKLRAGDPDGVDANRLELRQAPIEATGLATASVDVVVSNSVLEHVQDVDAALTELARITKPGGFGVHGIDTLDHRWYGEPRLHPLEFLTVDATQRMVAGCNRLRLADFRSRFERHGFALIHHEMGNHVAITPGFRSRLVEPWRSMPDDHLDRTWANALVRRV